MTGAIRAGNAFSPVLHNGTFAGNSELSGGAFFAGANFAAPLGHAQLINCVLWGNTSPQGPQISLVGDNPFDVTVAYCDVQGSEADVFVQVGFTLNWGPGNIDADPLFEDSDSIITSRRVHRASTPVTTRSSSAPRTSMATRVS